jgi:hypothetical protein
VPPDAATIRQLVDSQAELALSLGWGDGAAGHEPHEVERTSRGMIRCCSSTFVWMTSCPAVLERPRQTLVVTAHEGFTAACARVFRADLSWQVLWW